MPKEFKLPDLGEGIHEGEIVEVLVAVGDRVREGQTVLVVETDKATTEIPSPVTGTVHEIRVKPGDTVQVGSVLITFLEEGDTKGPTFGVQVGEKTGQTVVLPGEGGTEAAAVGSPAKDLSAAPPTSEGPVPASPSTRRLARELGVDLRRVTPTGPAGQVTSEDVRAYAESVKRAPEAPPKPAPPTGAPPQVPPEPEMAAPSPEAPFPATVERMPLRSVRRTTSRQMARSWSQIPHVSHEETADITELDALRRRHKGEIEAAGGALSLTVFLLKAAAAALKAFPRFNAVLDTDSEEILLKRFYHIGVAVDTDRGLIVPVIRDVDRKSITELARELRSLAQKTREGKAGREDMIEGTFTITNVGALGGTGMSPIINYPQVAILGTARARLQPVVRGDLDRYEIVPRLILPLVLTFDHRVLDGADAAQFLKFVVDVLEDPGRMLLQV